MNKSDRPKDIGLPESASTSVISASTVEPASTVESASSVPSADTVKSASDVKSAGSVKLSEVSASTVESASNVKAAGEIDGAADSIRNKEDLEEEGWDSDSEPVKPNMRPRGGVKHPVAGGGGSKK
ncbi:hypothetical protein EV368DRAFT_63266 [Lentinula lateritia]|nr:hypothetical protein EV368DRAFT_63266 [Lentinula lateritia]